MRDDQTCRGEVVGRLLNRSVIQLQAKDFVDPFERQCHTQATPSTSGGFYSWYDELHSSTECVTDIHKGKLSNR
jgi:hypothetical protein